MAIIHGVPGCACEEKKEEVVVVKVVEKKSDFDAVKNIAILMIQVIAPLLILGIFAVVVKAIVTLHNRTVAGTPWIGYKSQILLFRWPCNFKLVEKRGKGVPRAVHEGYLQFWI